MKHSVSPSTLIILLALVCIAAWSMSYSGGSGGSRSSKSSSSSRGSGDSGAVSVVASEFMERPLGREGDLLIEHTGYALVYNTETNCPDWVAWELTQEEADGKDARRVNDFRGDPLVPEENRVEAAD
ncbi:MAG: DNA/RNA non-specific endonuclease [Bacteroidaceae bacterium]|nr:DNA/RNA non-specific endonuclease [Bacteroidaceae bacterium]